MLFCVIKCVEVFQININIATFLNMYLNAKASSVFSIRDEYATSRGVLPLNDGLESNMLLFSNKNEK